MAYRHGVQAWRTGMAYRHGNTYRYCLEACDLYAGASHKAGMDPMHEERPPSALSHVETNTKLPIRSRVVYAP
jgi:hypothetical protein